MYVESLSVTQMIGRNISAEAGQLHRVVGVDIRIPSCEVVFRIADVDERGEPVPGTTIAMPAHSLRGWTLD